MFYNTTNLLDEKLKVAFGKNATQEQVIAKWFKNHADAEVTPFELSGSIQDNYPITSVRRTLTDLSSEGILEKVEGKRRVGNYGRENCLWRLKTNNK